MKREKKKVQVIPGLLMPKIPQSLGVLPSTPHHTIPPYMKGEKKLNDLVVCLCLYTRAMTKKKTRVAV
jgi:hypothetical protein